LPDPKECTKPHPMLHSAAGLGLGLVLAGLVPGLVGGAGLVIGIILLIVGLGGEFVFLPKKPANQ